MAENFRTVWQFDLQDNTNLDGFSQKLSKANKHAEGLNLTLSKTTKNAEGLGAALDLYPTQPDGLIPKKKRKKTTQNLSDNTSSDNTSSDNTLSDNNPALLGKFGKASGIKGLSKFSRLATLGAGGTVGLIAAVGAAAITTGKHLVNVSNEIRDNNAMIESSFSLSGTAAQRLSNHAAGLSRTFSDDYNNVVYTASLLTKELGTTGEQSLSLIEKGYKAGANNTGEMLSNLQQYAGEFKALGVSANQQISLLSQTDKTGGAENLLKMYKGLDMQLKNSLFDKNSGAGDFMGDILGKDYLKGLSANLNKGKITIAEATQQISKQLLSSKLPAKELEGSLVYLFGSSGKNMGLGMVENLANMNLNLDDAISKNGALSGHLSEQLEWEKAILAEQQKFAPTWSKIGDATNKAMNYLELGAYKAVNFASGLASAAYEANGLLTNFATFNFSGLADNFANLRKSITGEKAAAKAALEEGINAQITLYQQKTQRGEDVSAMEKRFYGLANTQGGQYIQKALGLSAKDYLANLRGEKTTPQGDLYPTEATTTTPEGGLSSSTKKAKKITTTGQSKAEREIQQSQRAIISGGTRNVTVTIEKLVETLNATNIIGQNGKAVDNNTIRQEISNILLAAIQNAEIMSS